MVGCCTKWAQSRITSFRRIIHTCFLLHHTGWANCHTLLMVLAQLIKSGCHVYGLPSGALLVLLLLWVHQHAATWHLYGLCASHLLAVMSRKQTVRTQLPHG